MVNEAAYYRAMSGWEYHRWQESGFVGKRQEWTGQVIARAGLGYSLKDLKSWVDRTDTIKTDHDLIIVVEDPQPWEFDYASRGSWMEDRHGFNTPRDEFGRPKPDQDLDEIMDPRRYVNYNPIAISRTKIVYDPRGVIVPGGVFALPGMRDPRNKPRNMLKTLWDRLTKG